MMVFLLLAVLLCLATLALLTRPLWRSVPVRAASSVGDAVAALSHQIKQLHELHAAGALTDAQYEDSKAAVERKLLASVSGASAPESVHPARRHSRGLVLAMAVFIPGVVSAGYYWIGSPANLDLGPASSLAAGAAGGRDASAQGEADAGGAAHPVTSEQIAAMVGKLAERLKQQPNDGDGWFMLARSYVALGRHADAVVAFKRAAPLRPDDAELFADYADALAVASNRSLEGEPSRLVDLALKLDPNNGKALALAGTAAFDRKDYAGAVRFWEKLVKVEPDSAFAQQVRAGIAEARQLAGGSAPPAPAATPVDDRAAVSPTPAGARVSGTVTLAASLASKASPEDTVFVFARAVDGPRMPLAILRKQVKDLPIQFTLDDSMAMSPSAKLSNYPRVMVGARVSKSGDAMTHSGDLQGISAPVAVGATGLKLEINEVVEK